MLQPPADDSDAIQRAIDDASRAAAASKQGVAVYLPEGTYVVRKRIMISSSYVVLRGVDVSRDGAGRTVCCSQRRLLCRALCEAAQKITRSAPRCRHCCCLGQQRCETGWRLANRQWGTQQLASPMPACDCSC